MESPWTAHASVERTSSSAELLLNLRVVRVLTSAACDLDRGRAFLLLLARFAPFLLANSEIVRTFWKFFLCGGPWKIRYEVRI